MSAPQFLTLLGVLLLGAGQRRAPRRHDDPAAVAAGL